MVSTPFLTQHCTVLTFPCLHLPYWTLKVASVWGQFCCLVLWSDQALHRSSYWQTLKLLLRNLHPFFDLARGREKKCQLQMRSKFSAQITPHNTHNTTPHNTHTHSFMDSVVVNSSKQWCHKLPTILQRIHNKVPQIIQIMCEYTQC